MHLRADVICFQEMKTSRSSLDRNVGTPDPFDGFFSFPANKGGYSGVAVYTDSRRLIPLKAEEGLSGSVQPKPPLSLDEHISYSYPCAHEMNLMPDEHGDTPSDWTSLDGEGRALVLDLGLFILINVYCPNETSDARLPFKMNYHFLLQERVNKLISEGREIIVVGDINICSTPLDHCDGYLASNAAAFYDHPARAWFRDWIGPNGSMIDVLRMFWPDRKGMYTCWNTKICARETNYGTRVDYILATRGILPWIKHGDIQPSVKGSDHCPMYIDLHDEITTDAGVKLSLREVIPSPVDNGVAALPRLAARRWDEFSGKQTLLSAFFARGAKVTAAMGISDSASPGSPSTSPLQASGISSTAQSKVAGAVLQDCARTLDLPNISCESGPPRTTSSKAKSPGIPKSGSQEKQQQHIPPTPHTAPPKRKLADVSTTRAKPNKKLRNAAAGSAAGKGTLNAFFTRPSQSLSQSQSSQSPSPPSPPSQSQEHNKITDDPPLSDVDPCADDDDLCTPRPSQTTLSLAGSSATDLGFNLNPNTCPADEDSLGSKAAWSKLMAPVEPPKCNVHGEPAKLYTVNKPGPNKGKTFFLCSRPVGPGWDKGKGERPRDEVNHAYRCNFFKWAAEVKRGSSTKSDNDGDHGDTNNM